MPRYQCPRCGGTDSFGQWEQRFKNTNVSYYDNRRHPIGSSNNGFGVSNVRQQYCANCVSVKMDFILTGDDINFIRNLLRGIGNLISALIELIVRVISRSAPYILLSILFGILYLAIESVNRPLPKLYLVTNLFVSLSLFLFVETYRKMKIRKEDNKFLKDRYYKLQLPIRRKRIYFISVLILIAANTSYLYTYQNILR
jgi:hypothetical protein